MYKSFRKTFQLYFGVGIASLFGLFTFNNNTFAGLVEHQTNIVTAPTQGTTQGTTENPAEKTVNMSNLKTYLHGAIPKAMQKNNYTQSVPTVTRKNSDKNTNKNTKDNQTSHLNKKQAKEMAAGVLPSLQELIKSPTDNNQLPPENQLQNYQIINHHGYQYATISLTNISRIVCNSNISSLIYSKNKQIEITKANDHNLFVQILPVKEVKPDGTTKLIISDYPRQVFIGCGDRIFSLILVPKNIPTATIVLEDNNPKENLNKIQEFLGGKSFGNQLSKLVVYAYKEVPPPGFRVEDVYKPYKKFQQLTMDIVRIYRGGPYKITEYLINAKENIHLYEGLFIPYLKHPLAISIVQPKLAKGQSTRMIVVSERKEEE